MRARTWIFLLAGAVLVGSATFFYGLLRFQNGWDGLTMKEFAIWLIAVGAAAGALVGLVVARVTLRSVRRRIRFIVLGALCGVLVGFVYGFSLEELSAEGSVKVDVTESSFLGWKIAYMASVALWTEIGGIAGTLVGLTTARLTAHAKSRPLGTA